MKYKVWGFNYQLSIFNERTFTSSPIFHAIQFVYRHLQSHETMKAENGKPFSCSFAQLTIHFSRLTIYFSGTMSIVRMQKIVSFEGKHTMFKNRSEIVSRENQAAFCWFPALFHKVFTQCSVRISHSDLWRCQETLRQDVREYSVKMPESG